MPEGQVPFDFRAGQWVALRAQAGGGRPVTRAYSVASPPQEKRFLELCIKEVPDGKLTPFLFLLYAIFTVPLRKVRFIHCGQLRTIGPVCHALWLLFRIPYGDSGTIGIINVLIDELQCIDNFLCIIGGPRHFPFSLVGSTLFRQLAFHHYDGASRFVVIIL